MLTITVILQAPQASNEVDDFHVVLVNLLLLATVVQARNNPFESNLEMILQLGPGSCILGCLDIVVKGRGRACRHTVFWENNDKVNLVEISCSNISHI